MAHRLFAFLVIVCFALGGAGCASESQRANREQVRMPLQTGSFLQRPVMIEREGATKKSKKKKDKKETKKEPKEPKRTTPKPTPAPEPEATPEQPVQESTPAPDRFR